MNYRRFIRFGRVSHASFPRTNGHPRSSLLKRSKASIIEETMRGMETVLGNIDGICFHIVDKDFRLIYATSMLNDEDLCASQTRGHCYELLANRDSNCPDCKSLPVFRSGSPFSGETQSADGRTFIVKAHPVEIKNGVVESVVNFSIDITERRKAEEGIGKSEQKFKTIFTSSQDALMTLVSNGKFTSGNKSTLRMFGCSDENDFTSRTPAAYSPEFQPDGESSVSKANRMMDLAMENGSHFFEWTHKKLNGEEFPATVLLTRTELDGIPCLLATVRDISLQKRMEMKLHESERKFRELVETLPMPIFEVDLSTTFTYVNPAAFDIFGYPRQTDVREMSVIQMIAPENHDLVQKNLALVRLGKKDFPSEYIAQKKDGTRFPVIVFPSIMRNQNGNPVGFRGVIVDLSDRRKLESEKEYLQKMELTSQLAGGIAHDFNNLLAAILGNASLARLELQGKVHSHITQLIEAIETSVINAAAITRQLLSISKNQQLSKEAVSLEELIQSIVKFNLSGSSIKPIYNFQKGLADVDVDYAQIERVIINLVVNAKHAMKNSGTMNISAREVEIKNTEQQSLLSGKYAEISISDTGEGIKEEYLSKIFEPFFTTKPQNVTGVGGSGLGLSSSLLIVKKHGGTITVQSKPGKGSTFTIYLPLANGKIRTSKTPSGLIKGFGNILFMDDEKLIQSIISKTLGKAGYNVHCAIDGNSAIEIFRSAKEAGVIFDAAILDLTIPGGMGGKETAQKLKEIDPNIKIIVSSGYSESIDILDYRANGFDASLPKPYTVADLTSLIAKVMGNDSDKGKP